LAQTIDDAVEGELLAFDMKNILAKVCGTVWAPKIYETLKEAAEMRPVDPVTVNMSEKA